MTSLPIDAVFEKDLDTLNSLYLQFEVPKILVEKGDESLLPEPSCKRLINQPTYSRLKTLIIHYQTEYLLLTWLDTFALFT